MPPTHLRPLGLGEILDAAFAIYRRHFATLFATALLGFLPIIVLFLGVFGVVAALGDADADLVLGIFFLLGMPLGLLAVGVVWGALVRQVSQAYLGGAVSVRDGLSGAFRRFFPLVGAFLLLMVALYAGFLLCFIPGILLGIMFFATFPAVMVEERGPIEAMGRSQELARGGWGEVFVTLLVVTLISYVPSMAVGVGSMAFLPFLGMAAEAGSDGAATAFVVLFYTLSFVVSALTTPFIAAGIVVLYYDRRVRTEALDLELAADTLGR